jgi:hypothetical protein
VNERVRGEVGKVWMEGVRGEDRARGDGERGGWKGWMGKGVRGRDKRLWSG